jgi:hypothetical protein
MKTPFLTALLSCLVVAAYAQGYLVLNNIDNSSSAPSTATSGGLFFLDTGNGPQLITQDFNAVFFIGPASGPTTTFSFVGAAAGEDNVFGPGYFFDLSGNSYPIPAVPKGSCTMTIQAWLGPADSYVSATTRGTATFQQRVADSTALPPPVPPSLVDMPSIVLTQIPEPNTFALAGLCAAALLLFRRRK